MTVNYGVTDDTTIRAVHTTRARRIGNVQNLDSNVPMRQLQFAFRVAF
jgi:hypothetical protein